MRRTGGGLVAALCVLAVAAGLAPAGAADFSTAVVGGGPAPAGAYPFYAQVSTFDDRRPAATWSCGGALVDARWVLTAAHCVTADDGRRVTAGTVVLGAQAGIGLRRTFAGVAVHPGYTGDVGTASIDLALIRLDQPVPFPVVAPATAATDAPVGSTVRIIGLGATRSGSPPSQMPSALRQADLTVAGGTAGYLTTASATASACNGDSGGPLLRDAGGGWTLVGVVSFGASGCAAGAPVPNHFVRVAAFGRWIDGVIGRGAPGYVMTSADGAAFPFGSVPYRGGATAWVEPLFGYMVYAVDVESTPSGEGYWILDRAGRVFVYGDAPFHGHIELAPGEHATSISSTLGGDGYWIFTDRGRVAARGHAAPYGDLAGQALNGAVLDSVVTASGKGYYMVGSDGGIFTFGDARFHGSTGGTPLNQPIVGIAPTPSGAGYWLVASDGGIFTFGDANFRGSTGAMALNQPVIGMVRYGNGYLLVARDGGIFTFADAPFLGSLGAAALQYGITAVSSV